MSSRRKETNALKAELRAAFPKAKFKVQRGRGTAYRWISVYTDLPKKHLDAIEKIAAKYAGTYFPDSIPGEFRCESCVNVYKLTDDAPGISRAL